MESDIEDHAAALEAAGWRHQEFEGFIAHIGGLWVRDGANGPAFGFLAQPFHANRNGVVHGGMLMSFIDRAFGMSARQAGGAERGATISLSHQFMAPMRVGRFASLEPRIARMTTRMAFVEGTVFCEDAAVVSAQGVWRLARSAD